MARSPVGAALVTAVAVAAAAVVFLPRPGPGYPDGPPAAHTGGFGEPTCRACHFDAELNASGGTLGLDGVPAAYAPGETYRLTITLARPGLARAGFQLAARYADGDRPGRQAGVIRPVDAARVEVVRLERTGVDYAQHREAGTVPVAQDSARWHVDWTAPDDGTGPVVFHVVANAANDDFSEFGDYVYATSRTASPGAGPRGP